MYSVYSSASSGTNIPVVYAARTMDDARGRPRRADARQNLTRVLDAASRLFARDGLQTSLADIAHAAGVGIGTIYRSFPDKDDLILAVYERRLQDGEQLAADAAAQPSAWDALVWFVEASARQLAADRGLREFVLGGLTARLGWSRAATSARLGDVLMASHRRAMAALEIVVARAKRDGELRADFEVTDIQLLAAAIQAATDFGGEASDLHCRVATWLIDGIRAHRSTPSRMSVPALSVEDLDSITRTGTTPFTA